MAKSLFAEFVTDFARLQGVAQTPVSAEVGRQTWKSILASCGIEDDPEKPIVESTFMGIRIRPADVPEGKFWPLEMFQ